MNLPLAPPGIPGRHPAPPESSDGDAPVSGAEAQLALNRILSSPLFCKAHRSSSLLRFLVEQAQPGAKGITNEYAIGIEVFGRDAATYNTGDDPIVRVQVGRLRSRLSTYYATGGKGDALRISIPLGSYLARMERVEQVAQAPRIAFQALQCTGQSACAASFTFGLNEELRYRLHREFGIHFSIVMPGAPAQERLQRIAPGFLLEGSVRHDADRLRITLRLLCLDGGGVAWSEQLDHTVDFSIAHQELLAERCCQAVRRCAWEA